MPAAVRNVAKNKDEKIASLEHQLGCSRDDYRACFFLFAIFLIATTVLSISLYNMDQKFNKTNTSNKNYKAYFEKKDKEAAFRERCNRLASISKKPFTIVREGLTGLNACNYEQAFLYSVQEIKDAILHYELGEVGK